MNPAPDYTILIVDDQVVNLGVLSNLLRSHEFEVLAARDGETALDIAQRARPDLILLDVILPGADGFEVCRRLKADKLTEHIPVIFMTVLEKIEDKIQGFQVGAADYITKPFQIEEVLARVTTQLRLRSLTRELQEANETLERRVAERTAQLAQVNENLQAEVVERRSAEEALSRANETLTRVNRAYKTLSECNRIVVHATREAELLQAVCQTIVDHHDYLRACIDLVEQDEAQTIRLVAQADGERKQVEKMPMTGSDSEQRQVLFAPAIQTGKPVIYKDILSDPDLVSLHAETLRDGYASVAVFPLLTAEQETIGVLTVYAGQVAAFTEEEIRLFMELATDMAFGISTLRTRAERQRTEVALQRSNDLLQAIIKAAPAAIIGLDLDGKVQLVWNPAAEQMLGWSAQEVMGRPLPSVPAENQEEFRRFREQIRRGLTLDGVEVHRQRRDGTLIDYSIYASPLHDTTGHISGNIAVLVDITERKKAETELRKLSRAVEQSPASVVITDTAGRIEYVNPKFTQLTGYALKEVLGQNPRFLKSGHMPAEEYEQLWETIISGGEWRGEFLNKKKNGEFYWEIASISPVRDAKGTITHFIAVKEDITERKRAEEALKEQYSTLRGIIDSTTALIFSVDQQFRYTSFNQGHAAAMQTLYAADIEIGRSILEYMTVTEDRETAKHNIDRALGGEQIVEESYSGEEPRSRRYYQVSHSPIKTEAGKIIGVAMLAQDMTERKRAEEALQESEKQFRLLAENSTDMISRHAPDGIYLYSSPACKTLLGYEPDELVGHSAYEFIHSTDAVAVRQSHTTIIDQPMVYTVQYRIRPKDGRYIWFETTSRTIRDSQTSEVIEIQAASRDITKRKQAEESEQQRRRIAETLVKATAVLNSTLDLDQVLDLILQQLHRTIDYDSASFLEIEGDHLVISACQGFRKSNEVLGIKFPLDPRLPNYRVVTEKTPLHLADVGQEYPHFQDQEITDPSHNIHTWLGVPVLSKGRVIGVIALDRLEIRPFTTEHIELATAFANQAAIALENAQLHKQTQRHAEELEQRVEERTTDLQQEILERRRVEEALRESEARHRIIAELTSDYVYSIIVHHPDGTAETDWMSGAVERITGYTAEEIRALPGGWNAIARPDGVAEFAPLWSRLLSGQKVVHEYQIATKRGEVRWLRDYKKPVWNEAEEHVTLIWGAVQDITERKQAEEALRERTMQLEAANEELRILSRVKDAFVSNVSHELRTPITNLKLRHHLLAARPDRWKGHLNVMSRETQRLEQIIESLLYLSRLDQDRVDWNPTRVDLNHLASQFVHDRMALAQSGELSLSFSGEPDLPLVEADEALWEQALSILLTNAFNYTPAGGHVEVRTQMREQGEQRWVGVSVSDTGPGISLDEQSHLFERFFRGTVGRESGAPGTGLGLSIVQEIVNKHHGQVEVFSEGVPGKGTTFSLWLLAATHAETA